jgi:predicted nucleic acid-binding protein
VAAEAVVAPFVDSNVLLYLVGEDSGKADRAEALLAGGIVISVQVLNEFANVALRKIALGWPRLNQALLDIRRFAKVEALTLEMHQRGLALAERYGFSIYDAMIIAAAMQAGCTRLISEDMQHGQRIAGRLTIYNPFR